MSNPDLTIEEHAAAFADSVSMSAESQAEELAAGYSADVRPFIQNAFVIGYVRRASEHLEFGAKDQLATEIIDLLAEIKGNWENPFKQKRLGKELELLAFKLAKLTLGIEAK